MNKIRLLFEQFDEEETEESSGEGNASTDVGKVYILKKLYVKLLSIDGFLKNTRDQNVENIRYLNDEAINMFELIIQNLDSYQDQIDDLIYHYYKFIEKMCKVLQKHFKKQKKDQKDANKRVFKRR